MCEISREQEAEFGSSLRSLVSAIIPVYDGGPYLAEAIRSALRQTYRDLEIIVVDDGSSDDSAEVAERFIPRITLLRQEHAGPAAARNAGAAAARGTFLAFLDADDLWEGQKLELQIAALQADEGLDMVFTRLRNFLSPEVDQARARLLSFPEGDQPGLLPSALVVRREAFARAGPFAPGALLGEFIDWFSRAADLGMRHSILPVTLVRRRVHGRNLTAVTQDSREGYLRAVRTALARRRDRALPEGSER